MSARQHVNIDLDAEVASILRAHAAEADLSEGEIIDRALSVPMTCGRSSLGSVSAATSTKTPQ
ncbi:MAG: hypothetical protein M3071_01670 [Actinomycetota bacterium]|nr:hypothetical protein [Actinomycetota bacterium]